jgi:pimeloyl-ACP methyl ester carboxylesterase
MLKSLMLDVATGRAESPTTRATHKEYYMNEKEIHQVISADGTEIGFFTSGEGRPLLLVHGSVGDHTRWDALLPYLEPHFTVYAMDRRGRGASGDHADYHIEREYEDVAAIVNTVAKSSGSAVTVYGSSYGGLCAFGAAALDANIRRLILYEGWPTLNPEPLSAPPEFIERAERLLAAGQREAVIETVAREVVKMTEEELEEYRSHPSWEARVAAAPTYPREERAFVKARFDPQQAAKITVPTLLLVGSDSPDDWHVETMATALPNARIATLEGQTHIADVIAPELVAEQVITFLR